MIRLTPTAVVAAALLGLFVTADIAEAAKSRSAVERRQRPGKGYFATKTTPTRSYNVNRSMFRSTPMNRSYSAPAYVTPAAPLVQQSRIPRAPVASAPRVIRSSPVVISPPVYGTAPRIISERVIRTSPAPTVITPSTSSSTIGALPGNPVR